MKNFKRFIAAATLAVMVFSTSSSLKAQEYYQQQTGGYGYTESRRAPSIAPAIALGVIAAVAIIAVAIQNSNNHGHNHSH